MSGNPPGRSRGRGRGHFEGGRGHFEGGRGHFEGGRGHFEGGRGRGDGGIPFHIRASAMGPRDSHGTSQGQRGRDRGDSSAPRGRGRGRGGIPIEAEVFRRGDGQVPAPDKEVERIENESAIEAKKHKPTESNPQRPGYGTAGQEVTLWANYFNLYSQKNLELYRYNVAIIPNSAGRVPVGKKAKRIIELLLEQHFLTRRHNIATDFKSTLVSPQRIELEDDEYLVVYRQEGDDVPIPNAPEHRCRVQFTGTLSLSDLINHLTSTQAGLMFNSQEEIIQAMNIVLGHHPKAQPTVTTIGSNRHFNINAEEQQRMSLGAGIEVIRGFFMSVRAATARVLINVQIKNLTFYEEGPLDKIMSAFTLVNGPDRRNLFDFVKKLSIDVTHIKRTNSRGQPIPRIKTVQGFATKDDGRNEAYPPIVSKYGAGPMEVQFFLHNTQSFFKSTSASGKGGGGGGKKGKKSIKAGPAPPNSGRYISIFDFFKETYKIVVSDPTLPVVNVGTKDNPSYLPPDVCYVRQGQPAGTKLSSSQTQQMIRFAVQRPHRNAQSIVTSGGRLLGFEPTNPTLTGFDINVPPELIIVPGRVLNVPIIKYSGTSTVFPKFGDWRMQSVKFVTKSDLPSWTYLRISLGGKSAWKSDEDFNLKLNELQDKLRELGMSVQNYMQGLQISPNAEKIESAIDDCIHRFAINQKRPRLVLVIIPDGVMTAAYNRVKYICDVKEGILNICVRESKFVRADAKYLANVALKFNLKLGGRNHSLDPAKLGLIAQRKTMVIGIDVTHPSPGSSSKAPSVAGIVASVDEWLGQWPAEMRIQPPRQEMVDDLEAMFKSRLLLWREKNKTLPENILIYRDGVSESQYNIVLAQELPRLRAACTTLYPAPDIKAGKPRITIIIVGKRHNTRFYPTKKEEADRGGNPFNGTVVDRGVTEAHNWDFFLQAHAAIQGTARPAHYYVIYDQIFRDIKLQARFPTAADALEDLTHNMCYLFGRAPKAVSICPPAYYADLVCTRARCYLSGLFDPQSPSSPDTSSVGTGVGGASQSLDSSLVTIHPNVKNTMFYV